MPRKKVPTWYENQMERQREYNKKYTVGVSCRFNKFTDSEIIEIWKIIPNKNKFLKDCVIRYAKEELGMEIKRNI
jgi:hypothetical protein